MFGCKNGLSFHRRRRKMEPLTITASCAPPGPLRRRCRCRRWL